MKIVMAGSAKNQRLAATSSHDLDPEGLFPAIIVFQVFQCPNMVGSGAVVPFGDRPSPALRTVRAACHRTRLALYALLERVFVRERACMELVMAISSTDNCFPLADRYYVLSSRLFFLHLC